MSSFRPLQETAKDAAYASTHARKKTRKPLVRVANLRRNKRETKIVEIKAASRDFP